MKHYITYVTPEMEMMEMEAKEIAGTIGFSGESVSDGTIEKDYNSTAGYDDGVGGW